MTVLSLFVVSCAVSAAPVKKKAPAKKAVKQVQPAAPAAQPEMFTPDVPPPPVYPKLPPSEVRTGTGPASRFWVPLDIAVSAGIHSGIGALLIDQKWDRPFDLKNIAVKTGVAYAQGKDQDRIERKNALVFVDGVYMLPFTINGYDSNKPYIGGGLNYLVLTSGQKSGTVGGEVYLGIESHLQNWDKHYVELGYSAIRTGFSPCYKGLYFTVGYRRKL